MSCCLLIGCGAKHEVRLVQGGGDLGVSQAHHPQGENGTGAPGWLATREMGDELTALLLEPNLHSTRMDRLIEPPLLRTPAGAAPPADAAHPVDAAHPAGWRLQDPFRKVAVELLQDKEVLKRQDFVEASKLQVRCGWPACGRCGCSSTHATSGALRAAGLCWASNLGE